MCLWNSPQTTLRLLLAAVLGLLLPPLVEAQPTTTRVSVGPGGVEGNDQSAVGVISADGRWVAFVSRANNLVPEDTNDSWDVFVHDLQTGATTRVSVGPGGAQANSSSDSPAISADGRWVAFHSDATNLVANDTNGQGDIFVRDRQTGSTTLLSVATGGGQGNSSSFSPSISADGRWVAFSSDSSFVPGDTNGQGDIFVHDLETGVTTRVSLGPRGAQANAHSVRPAISGDGRWVAFESFASNLVATDTNGEPDVFVHDRQSGTTTRVSMGMFGSFDPTISADGRWVAFSSAARLVFEDTNNSTDVFVHDRQTGTTVRVSVGAGGAEANDFSFGSFISADGRWVAFGSLATNLVADDTNGEHDVFVHDRETGTTTRVSVGPGGVQANALSYLGAISAGGRRVAFQSSASNLVPDDTNDRNDVFVHDRGSADCTLALVPGRTLAPAAGMLGRVLVVGPADCAWTAASNDPDWLTVTEGASGTGFGTIEFTVAANTGAPRTGTITIGGHAFTVEQADVVTPMAPTGLFVHSVIGNRVTLRWTMPHGGPAPTGFVLEGGVPPGDVLVSVPTGSLDPAFVFDAPAGSFHARVHAVNGVVRSAASNEIRIHVNVPLPPSPPANLLGVVNGSTVTLAWTNTYEGGAPTSLVLEVPGALFLRIPLGLTDHVTFVGVPAGTYSVLLRAQNASGQSEQSNPLRLTFPGPCTGPPAVPIDLLAYRVGRAVSVFWAPGTTGPAPTAYVLIVTGSTVDAFVLTERSLSTAVGPGEYTLSVVAINPCGISGGTPPQTVVVP